MSGSLFLSADLWLAMARGLQVTVVLTILSMTLGLLLAVPVAAAKLFGSAPLRAAATAYIFVFRGVPLLMLLYFLYYGSGQVEFLRETFLWDLVFSSAFATTVLAFTLSNSAYLAEALRGGMLTVRPGDIEAGYAIGLSGRQIFNRITLPIALRNSVLTIGNEAVFTIKASVIASIVTVRDVLGEAQRIGAIRADNLVPLACAALVFIVLVQVVEQITKLTDRRLNQGVKYDARPPVVARLEKA